MLRQSLLRHRHVLQYGGLQLRSVRLAFGRGNALSPDLFVMFVVDLPLYNPGGAGGAGRVHHSGEVGAKPEQKGRQPSGE